MDFAAIEDTLDEGEDRIVADLGAILGRIIADLVAQGAAVFEAGDVEDLPAVTVDASAVDEMAEAVSAGLEEIYREGQAQARAEKTGTLSVRLAVSALDPAAAAEVNRYLGVHGIEVASRLAERFRAEFLKEAARQAARGQYDPATIIDLLTGLSDYLLRQDVRILTSEAMGIGRMSVQDAELDGATGAEYSARLDANTCDVCAALHGTRFEPGSPEYYAAYPPLSDLSRPEDRICHGRDLCRCLMILEYGPVQEPRG